MKESKTLGFSKESKILKQVHTLTQLKTQNLLKVFAEKIKSLFRAPAPRPP